MTRIAAPLEALMDHASGLDMLFDPATVPGMIRYGVIAFVLASLAALAIRKSARRVEAGLSDVTLLEFVSVFAQLLVYLIALVLYAHLVPQLRTIGTALLAGAGVASVVAGLAAQDTLGNLIAGFSLVLSKAFGVGDAIQVYSLPFPLRIRRASGSVVDACVSLLRGRPRKSSPRPSSSPSLGRKLLCEAQASSSVPSTEKCSSLTNSLTRASSTVCWKKC